MPFLCWFKHDWKYEDAPAEIEIRAIGHNPLFRKCIRCKRRERNYNSSTFPSWKQTDWIDGETVQGLREIRKMERFLSE